MLRDFKFLRRNSGKNEEPENIPVNQEDFVAVQVSSDPSRAPLNSIQEKVHNPKQEQDKSNRSKVERTPSKATGKASDTSAALPLRTPDKHGASFSSKNRFGWAGQKNELGDEFGNCSVAQLSSRVVGNMTPRAARTVARPPVPSFSECTSTQSTPTKSVSKPLSSVARSKVDGAIGGGRGGNFGTVYKASSTVVNSIEVPHFDLKEDPSFWMEHNVQVLIRVRPLNTMERSTNGYSRCLKQESAQTIGWIGHPETRFRFDHVACETVDQEMLFRMACLPMVENCLSGYNSCMFAYGQTGSGKTYTMLGEIENLEHKPSPHRGMTPRIFEFLFARIQAEEESRRDENLKYNCKCSFLEIYNEQITDLLDPSSTNLLLREDNKDGVYVENLSEFEVHTVSDILSLLIQGSSNRKVAATNMNRESSRSHSVFTCVIESRWEKESTTNLRFSRLNLVDLAGSERQKTSGAEGERLKEAANINKSLSTLGHVIMVLVDVAQGKPRHIPYRDSRLTFLLQDSLGGNSKTMIIANVSPSICSAAETLNTLKFAQRAKMIQNNAVVNEDSTGDVAALQHQIRLLKEELYILKRQNVSRSLSFGFPSGEDTKHTPESSFSGHVCDMDVEDDDDFLENESKGSVRMSTKQLKCLETTLAGALRREKMAETSMKKLEAEIEQLNRLVRQREEDSRSSKMMLRFREDKIQRMESVVNGSVPPQNYLLEENRALSEEIQLLQTKLDRNPEVTRFAHENIRLLEQLRRYQEFYEEGEKEILLTEVSNLRDQLLQFLDGNIKQQDDPNISSDIQESSRIYQRNDSLQPELENTHAELAECRRNLDSCLSENERLCRELENLRSMFIDLKSSSHIQEERTLRSVQIEKLEPDHEPVMTENAEEIVNLQLELDILKIIMKEEKSSTGEMEERLRCLNRELERATEEASLISKHYDDAKTELEEARAVIEALESQQILTINEVEDLRRSYNRQMKIHSTQEVTIKSLKEQLSLRELKKVSSSTRSENNASLLKDKVNKMQCSLENAKRLNMLYQNDREFQVSNDEEMDEVRKQVEAETAEVIVCLEEELAVLQNEVQDRHQKEIELNQSVMLLETELKEVHEKVDSLTNDNQSFSIKLNEKDEEIRTLSKEWSLLTSEIEEVLADGCESLTEASNQLEDMSTSLPQKRIWISEHVGRMARALSEKEMLIEELRRCLEDANNTRSDVESMLKSLRGATMVITEAHQRESIEKEKNIKLLNSQLSAEKAAVEKLQKDNNMLSESEQKARESITCLTAQLLGLQAMMDKFECQSQLKMEDTEQRLLSLRGVTMVIAEAHQRESSAKEKNIKLLNLQLSVEKASVEKLQKDNNMLSESEHKARESMAGLTALLLDLQAKIDNFECQSLLKMEAVKQRLVAFELIVQEACSHSHELKEVLELEADDAKMAAVQNAAEVACVLSKFEEAQDIIKDADIMINGLMIENERIKLEVKQLKKANRSLRSEKTILAGDIQNLQSVNNLKSQQCEQLVSDLGETQSLVSELEGIVAEFQIYFKENFTLLDSDFQTIKSLLFDSSKLVRTWLESIWSEIIMKDCAVSVLHLCHMGVLLETVTGQNAENGLLQHGLCESNAIIADLREHNNKSIKELEICRVMKGKLLIDIKSAFDRISRKEEENQELSVKMTSFDKKVSDLQSQEELMLQRSNYIGSQLALLMKDVDLSNKNLAAILFDQEKVLQSQADFFMVNWCVKDLESVILASELKEVALQRGVVERAHASCDLIFENLKKEFVILMIDSALEDHFLRDEEVEASSCQLIFLDQKNQDLNKNVTLLESRSYELKSELERKETELTRMLRIEEENALLRLEIDQLKEENSLILQNLQAKISDVESSLSLVTSCDMRFENLKKELVILNIDSELIDQISREEEVKAFSQLHLLDKKNQDLHRDVTLLETRSYELKSELERKEAELTKMLCFEKENESLRVEIDQLKRANSSVLHNLQAKNSEAESSSSKVIVFMKENHSLKDEISAMETRIAGLQSVLEAKTSELRGIQQSQHSITEELCLKSQEVESSLSLVTLCKKENESLLDEMSAMETRIASLQSALEAKTSELRGIQQSQHAIAEELCLKSQEVETYGCGISALKEENRILRDELSCLKKSIVKYFDSVDGRLLPALSKEEGFAIVDKTLQQISESVAKKTHEFIEQLEQVKCQAKDLEAEKSYLQTELLRKDEILEGLQFDLSLLQESASKTKDQNDEIEEMMISLEALKDELSVKTIELVEAAAVKEDLRAELLILTERITGLESDLSKGDRENLALRDELERALVIKRRVEEELDEAKKVNEGLETEVLEMGNAIDRRNCLIETLKRDVLELETERDDILQEMAGLKDRLEAEQARADESDAIAKEAKEWADSRNAYAEEKDAISKLLEKTVEELEYTINVIQKESDITRGEADRQRLLREEIELELHAVQQQLHNVQNVDADIKRYLEEKDMNLQEVHQRVQILERDIKEKDGEISQLKGHIAELNLHAEAQASEYKQKFKALEAMAENVKPDSHFINAINSSSPKKTEKFAARPRGSGSPFKCIGLGISQQIKSERDEELTAARQRIEELESLAASQQKDIFSLNATLAKTDSMTHDLMRDLLGVKLNMTACSSLANDQQIREIAEKVRLQNLESDEMEQEVVKVRKHLKEFIKERQGWLEEIDRKQAEVIATQVTLEKLRQHNQSLKSENEILKIESVNHQQRLTELEGEIKKLSGHQNLHQRIHHHAKIKDENNTLKIHNEELSTKLRRAEAILARVKEELSNYRASVGKNSHIDFDEERRLSTKLKETQEEKMQLAQKLLGLCSNVLKAAGITKPLTEISPLVAEEALEQIKNTITTMDRELQDLKCKYKTTKERIRLSELMPQVSMVNSRDDENRRIPKSDSQSPYFSPLDR